MRTLQGKPYALFGTCLGAIIAYEICHLVENEKLAPNPIAFFPAAVSPPHLYSLAVMKLYMTRALDKDEPNPLEEVMNKLWGWETLPKETVMMVGLAIKSQREIKITSMKVQHVTPSATLKKDKLLAYYDCTHLPEPQSLPSRKPRKVSPCHSGV